MKIGTFLDAVGAPTSTAIGRGAITCNAASYVELGPAKRPKAIVREEHIVEEWLRTGEKPSPVMVWTPEQAGQFLDFLADTGERLYGLFHLITYTDEVLEEHRIKQDAERLEWGEAWPSLRLSGTVTPGSLGTSISRSCPKRHARPPRQPPPSFRAARHAVPSKRRTRRLPSLKSSRAHRPPSNASSRRSSRLPRTTGGQLRTSRSRPSNGLPGRRLRHLSRPARSHRARRKARRSSRFRAAGPRAKKSPGQTMSNLGFH
ncbi:hypothetical protein [Streptomyces sp. NPDC059008]|uniref:hypothetical protein n=1 Tax=Streptomyces sp. NPDC059008 TaxID=3346693 RepID=UPI0036A6B433